MIEALQVTKSFRKSGTEVGVLKGVNFHMQWAECVAITGASGVGKSTLLHLLGALEPPTSGKIIFRADPQSAGQDLQKMSEAEVSIFRNRMLGFVFQFHYLLPEFSALENVMMPALIADLSPEVARTHALKLLQFVGLGHRLDHRPNELSGGEQQRVAIARAVILRPKLLLADELTGNLDSQNRNLILDLLLQLNQSTGVGILLVTHDQEVAQRMNRVLVMRDGQFV